MRCLVMFITASFIIWLALWTGEMNRILRCDWLPERQDGAIFPARDYPLYVSRKNISPKAM